jgi:hypothetical protein
MKLATPGAGARSAYQVMSCGRGRQRRRGRESIGVRPTAASRRANREEPIPLELPQQAVDASLADAGIPMKPPDAGPAFAPVVAPIGQHEVEQPSGRAAWIHRGERASEHGVAHRRLARAAVWSTESEWSGRGSIAKSSRGGAIPRSAGWRRVLFRGRCGRTRPWAPGVKRRVSPPPDAPEVWGSAGQRAGP